MDTEKLAGLYRSARQVRDDTVKELTTHALAQVSAVEATLGDAEPGEKGTQADHLARRALAEVDATKRATAELLESRDVAAEPAVAEAIAAEAVAAEAIAAEALAAEAVESRFAAETSAVDAAVKESSAKLAASLQTFAAEFNEITGEHR